SPTLIVWASTPSATARIAMSRSVSIPTSLPSSTTGTEPSSSLFMICAASASDCADSRYADSPSSRPEGRLLQPGLLAFCVSLLAVPLHHRPCDDLILTSAIGPFFSASFCKKEQRQYEHIKAR